MSKVIILNGSPRKDGNSAAMCKFAEKYFKSRNIDTETFVVYDSTFSPCLGCDVCHDTDTQICVHQDSAADIIGKMKASNGVFVALPLYSRASPGSFKSLQDRFYVEYNFAKNGFTKYTSPDKKLAIAITYGGSPDDVAETTCSNIAFAFQDLGYGGTRFMLFGDQRHKNEFIQSKEQQESVEDALGWLADTK